MSASPVLVTGATGFVGSHLVDALRAAGRPVRAIVRASSDTTRLRGSECEIRVAALSDAQAWASALDGVDVVFHLAAATRARDEAEYRRANVEPTAALMAAVSAMQRPARVVFLGTIASVGPALDGRPVSEDAAPRPLTAYGRSKLEAERVVLGSTNVPAVVLRPQAIYGPRDRDLFTFFRLARLGIQPVPAGPDRPVQLIHVRDVVTALLAAADSAHTGRVYHIAEPAIRPWSQVAALIADAVGRRPIRVALPRIVLRGAALLSEGTARLAGRSTIFNRDKVRELLAPAWICTTDRAAAELNFRAAIPLEQGIRETADWYRTEGWLTL